MSATYVPRNSLPEKTRTEMITTLNAIIQQVREGIACAQRVNDSATLDIHTDVQRSAEKYLWLLEAHIPRVGAGASAAG